MGSMPTDCSPNPNHHLVLSESVWYFKITVNKVPYWKSTKQTEISKARRMRDLWYAKVVTEGPGFLRERNAISNLTVKTVIDHYKTHCRDLQPETILGNINHLYRVLTLMKCRDTALVADLPDIMISFRDTRNHLRRNSVNSMLNGIKSIFNMRMLEIYKRNGLDTGGMATITQVVPLRGEKPEGLPPLENLLEADAHSDELVGDLRKAWLLVRKAAMRNKEIYELRTEALKTNGEVFWIEPNHTKTGTDRQIPITKDVYEVLLDGANGHVIPGTLSYRMTVLRFLSNWLRKYIPPHYQKTVYAVRKYCESLLVEQHGTFKASKIAGHSREVGYRHYQRVLELPEPLKS